MGRCYLKREGVRSSCVMDEGGGDPEKKIKDDDKAMMIEEEMQVGRQIGEK